jgi:tellurium resistance protein TerD
MISIQKNEHIDIFSIKEKIGYSKIILGVTVEPLPIETEEDLNLDMSTFMLDKTGKLPNSSSVIFFNNRISEDEAILSFSDEIIAGSNNLDIDDAVKLDFTKIDTKIEKIIFVITSWLPRPLIKLFGNTIITIALFEEGTQEKIVEYNITSGNESNAIELAKLYKENDIWKFQVIDKGYKEDENMAFFIKKYYPN